MMQETSIQRGQNGLLIFAAALSGFAIPISTAAQNIGAGLLLLGFLIRPASFGFGKTSLKPPFAIAGLALFGALVLGMAWTTVPLAHAGQFLLKMRAYLLIPVFLCLFAKPRIRNAMLLGFAAGTLLSVLAAYVSYWFKYPMLVGVPGDWAVFRTHTYHNFFAGILAVGLLAALLRGGWPQQWRWAGWALFVFVCGNILFVVPGRTGQIIFIGMIGLVLLLWRWRIGLVLGLLIVVASAVILPRYSTAVQTGITKAQGDMTAWSKGDTDTSIGLRLVWLKDGVNMVKAHPFLGTGTGSFHQAYMQFAGVNQGLRATTNPHNDYLWLSIELGVGGALLLLALMLSAAWQGRQLDKPWQLTLYALLAGMAVSTTANSFFTDNITGLAFVLLTCALLNGPAKEEKAQ